MTGPDDGPGTARPSTTWRRAVDTVRLIAIKDLRQRTRDRSALLVSVVAPLGLAIVLNQLVGSSSFHVSYAVVDLDGGPLGAAFHDQVLGPLESAGVADVVDVPTELAARDAVGAGADAALIIPQGFSQAIETGRPTTLTIVGVRDRALAVEIAQTAAGRFAAQATRGQLAVATVTALDGSPPDAGRTATISQAATDASPAVTLVDGMVGLHRLDLMTFFSAAMAAMFLFFATQAGLVSVFEERQRGTLNRILAGPVAPWTVLAGKLAGALLVSALAITFLIVATTVLIGADWGPALGVAALSLGLIVAALGISAAVTSFAGNAALASAAGAIVAITLAILGGTLSPTPHGPDVLTTVALLTPHGWFLRGLADLHGDGATVADALPAVAVLLAMGGVTLAIGVARARNLVRGR